MRKVILFAICFAISFVCAAQNERVINGFVYGENGGPIAGATVSAVESDITAKTDAEGRFSITIPSDVTRLRADNPGYHPLVLWVDGPFLVFKMKIDQRYADKVYEFATIEAKLARDSEERIKDAESAKSKAKKLAKRRKLDAIYNEKYKNIGFVHSIEVMYGYQIGQRDVVYKNLGYREYGSLHPVELDYTFAYRFDNYFSLGIGAGLQYQLVNLCNYGDVFEPKYSGQENFTPINVPLFLNAKVYMSRGRIQPLFSVSGGIYLPNMEGMADVGIGLNLRLNRTANMYLLFACRTTPYGDFREYTPGIYDPGRNFFAYYTGAVWTPSFKIGCTF